ncbi:MAG: hypothetical protein V1934_05265 [Methanobacteriota archaeon]
MKSDKNERPMEGCNCLNCRLERMEAAIVNMNESVKFMLDGQNEMPGMPKEKNRINKK